jgi:MFS family permease
MNLTPEKLFRPTRVRYGVLAFASTLSMITYLDRACIGTVAPYLRAEFNLSEEQMGQLFAAFTLAYALFEVPSGWLGDVYGPRKTLIRIVLWWSLFTALTGFIYPSANYPWLGFAALLAVRFLFGMGEAGAYPNIARAFHNWFPFHERGLAQGAVWMAGRFAGGATPLVVLALLYKTSAPSGKGDHPGELLPVVQWRHAFWLFGAVGLAWCAAFSIWFRDTPGQKASVNDAERELIRQGQLPDVDHSRVPWLKLLRSGNLWLLCFMYACGSYGWYFNLFWLPTYLKNNYGVTADTWGFWTTSLLTGAPLLLGSCACLLGGVLTDQFIRRTGNRKWGRRLFGVLGHGTCALCYFLALFANNPWAFVAAVALAAFFNDMTMGAAWASCLDIGGRYSGIVAGCMNTIGNLGGAAATYATGWVLDRFAPANGYAEGLNWQINFISFTGVYIIATLLWLNFDATRPVAGNVR